ncbi:MAG: hypothetical protein DRQ56_05595, partial [Gammaproteobacteria bacterium]
EAEREAQVDRERAAKEQHETKAEQDRRLAELAERDERDLQAVEPVKPETLAQATRADRVLRPTDLEIIDVLSKHYGASFPTVRGWLADMQRREVA